MSCALHLPIASHLATRGFRFCNDKVNSVISGIENTHVVPGRDEKVAI